jgi:hypothetical protein
MRKLLGVSLACGVALAVTGALRSDEQADATALVDKALKAMGGTDKVAKFKSGTWKGKATAQEGGKEVVLTSEGTWHGTDMVRIDAEITGGGKTEKVLAVINGDKGWLKAQDMVRDAPDGELPMMKSALYAVRMPHLLPDIKGKDFKLSNLGEVKVGDKPALGIGVAHKDYKDVKLFFDKETALPAKSEVRLADPMGRELLVEFLYGDYKEADGIKHPMKISIKVEGKELMLELSEIKSKDKVDESEFAKP